MAFGSEQWMYASGGFYDYPIDQSLRFNRPDAAYLTRTPASVSNRKTWTWSGWVKRSDVVSQQAIFNAGRNVVGVQSTGWSFIPSGELRMYTATVGVSNEGFMQSTAVFRDPSAWYHLVLVIDSTQTNQDDRVKAWVNGESIPLVSQGWYVQQNYDTAVNSTLRHDIGHVDAGGVDFGGYMAEVNFIDGQALDPTSFGEFKSGVWIPKSYSGTYGTNGFRLDFGNSGSLGADVSGNSNNWTSNNLASTDQMLDSPTNSFATWNALESEIGLGFSEGNLYWMSDNVTFSAMRANLAYPSSGKWYWEMCPGTKTSTASVWMIGIANKDASLTEYLGQNANGHAYYAFNGTYYTSGSSSAYGDSWTTGDVIGVAWDADTGSLYLYKNNVIQNSGTAMVSGLTGEWFPAVGDGTGNDYQQHKANFGQDSSFAGTKTAQGNTDANGIGDFYYAPPAGYLALCTTNLPDPAIDPAQDDVPADYFNTVLYTGDDTSPRSITGVGFQPDFVWMKSRSATLQNGLHDAVRGGGRSIYSNLTSPELINEVSGYLSSFDADGFTTTAGSSNNRTFNYPSVTYVAWNWKADGSGVTNTDGTITSTVSANQKAGFSIVSYTGNQTNGATVGHGLTQKPDMIISKSRGNVNGWPVYHKVSGATHYLRLNETSQALSSVFPWNNTEPTASVFTLNANDENNTSGQPIIAYCFHSVDGYSKFGSYTGNGSTDGPFVYTGFRPAFVMVKSINSTNQWYIYDTARDPYNPEQSLLIPNSSGAEFAWQHVDYLSNGFKIKSENWDWNYPSTIIYMAFAEMPFKYSNAR